MHVVSTEIPRAMFMGKSQGLAQVKYKKVSADGKTVELERWEARTFKMPARLGRK
jgi:hypothetical protein